MVPRARRVSVGVAATWQQRMPLDDRRLRRPRPCGPGCARGRAASRRRRGRRSAWRSMRIPLARSIIERRSRAVSSCETCSVSCASCECRRSASSIAAWTSCGILRPREAVDPPRGGPGEEVAVVARLHDGDDRPAGGLAQLVDEIERVLEIVVDRDDRQVRVLLGDALAQPGRRTPRRPPRGGPGRRGPAPSSAAPRRPRRRRGRSGLVSCRSWNPWFPRRRSPRYHPSGVRA